MATVPNGTLPGRGKLPSSVATFSPPPQLSLSPQLAQGEPSSKSPGKPASQRDGRNGHSAQPPPPPPTPQRSNGSPMPPTPNPTSASGGGGQSSDKRVRVAVTQSNDCKKFHAKIVLHKPEKGSAPDDLMTWLEKNIFQKR